MVVADTVVLISLTAAGTLDPLLEGFDVRTTDAVVEELEDLTSYEGETAEHAKQVSYRKERITDHEVESPDFRSARVDGGEGSCVRLTRNLSAGFLITDGLRALPELRALTEIRIAISPIVLKALIERGALAREGSSKRLNDAAEGRDWLDAPIYRGAGRPFDG